MLAYIDNCKDKKHMEILLIVGALLYLCSLLVQKSVCHLKSL